MFRDSVRTVITLSAMCLTIAVVGAQQPGPAPQRGGQQAPAVPAGPLAPEKYKDIQVLKDVPASQLDVTMRYFVAATGLQCQTCHVRDQATGEFAYEKDTRTKSTARQMIQLVQTVNAGDFGARINCGTCHAGNNQPRGLQLAQMMTPEQAQQFAAQQAAMAARQGGGGDRGGAPPAGAPGQGGRGPQTPTVPMDDILNKYTEAIGGSAAVAAIKSLVITGTLTQRTLQAMPFTIEKKGAKFRETLQSQPMAITRGFDGTTGWGQAGTNVAELTGFPLDQIVRYADVMLPADLKQKYSNLASIRSTPIPAATPGGTATATVGLRGGIPGVITETFTFDASTGLLLRRSVTTSTGLNGRLVEQFDYADYRAVNGVKLPFEITRTNWNTLDTLKVSSIKANTNIDDARFSKPAK